MCGALILRVGFVIIKQPYYTFDTGSKFVSQSLPRPAVWRLNWCHQPAVFGTT